MHVFHNGRALLTNTFASVFPLDETSSERNCGKGVPVAMVSFKTEAETVRSVQ